MTAYVVVAAHRDTGEIVTLRIEAVSPDAATRQVMQMGYVVGTVRPLEPGPQNEQNAEMLEEIRSLRKAAEKQYRFSWGRVAALTAVFLIAIFLLYGC